MISEMIRFYQEAVILDLVDLDYRIKSEDSCIRKYNKFYPDMRLEKVFNDILGFRMLTDSYASLLEGEKPEEVRIVDMSHGKAKDDGYRGVSTKVSRQKSILSGKNLIQTRKLLVSFRVCMEFPIFFHSISSVTRNDTADYP